MFENFFTKKNILISIGVCAIIVALILLLNSSSDSSKAIIKAGAQVQNPITEVQKYNRCEIFPRCNFNKDGLGREELINKYPDLNFSDKTIIYDAFTIVNTTDLKVDDVCIQSIKSEGYVITLYSKPNFTGEKMTLTDKINIECFEKPMRSARVDIM